MVDTIEDGRSIGAVRSQQSLARRWLRASIHFLSYHFILKRERTTVAQVAGFRLTVQPTVFHPRYFRAGEYFADFLRNVDLSGKRAVDIGTGSGIIALAAARAGATSVLALDINPNAARTASVNAQANGLGDRVSGVCSNLLSALAPRPMFDVILSNPPWFPGEPRDLADRAWHAGPDYRDIIALFEQARERMAAGGRFYLMLSSDSDMEVLGALIEKAHLRSRVAYERSIIVEKFIVYELWADKEAHA